MLMYGEDKPEVLSLTFSGTGMIFNLTSYKEGYNRLNLLVPPNELGRFTDRDFDIAYANYVIGNDAVFCQFFWIIYNLYIGNHVFIIANPADWSENILESLLKLIQQRYGYNAIRIDNDDDYIYAANFMNPGFAPGFGLYNLDQDKERFTYLMESYRLANNGALPYQLDGFVVPPDNPEEV